MARIPTVREDDPATPPEAREFLKRVEGGLGEVFNSILREWVQRGCSLHVGFGYCKGLLDQLDRLRLH